MSTELVLANRGEVIVAGTLIKDLTHSALKSRCLEAGICKTTDLLEYKFLKEEAVQLYVEKKELQKDLETEKEKSSKLDKDLKAKQKEYDTMRDEYTAWFQQGMSEITIARQERDAQKQELAKLREEHQEDRRFKRARFEE